MLRYFFYITPDTANFVLKFPNFRCHGNQGQGGLRKSKHYFLDSWLYKLSKNV